MFASPSEVRLRRLFDYRSGATGRDEISIRHDIFFKYKENSLNRYTDIYFREMRRPTALIGKEEGEQLKQGGFRERGYERKYGS